MGSYNFVTADKFGKNDWPLVLEFRSFLAFFGTKFVPLARSRSCNPGGDPSQQRHWGLSYDLF